MQVANIGVYDYMDGDVNKQLQSRTRRVVRTWPISRNAAIMNPFDHPDYAFCVISHRCCVDVATVVDRDVGHQRQPVWCRSIATPLPKRLLWRLALVGLVAQPARSRARRCWRSLWGWWLLT